MSLCYVLLVEQADTLAILSEEEYDEFVKLVVITPIKVLYIGTEQECFQYAMSYGALLLGQVRARRAGAAIIKQAFRGEG